jgi:protein-L-isoaspartate(D-aspartate) O-methyltransferase
LERIMVFQQMGSVFGSRLKLPIQATAKRTVTVEKEEASAKAAFVLGLRARGIRDLSLLRALEKVPRERFVPHRYADLAGRDLALPIGCGQTLSEAWLVARMVETLAPSPQHRVLEIGTGSGYATAILAELAREVLSVERFQSLAIAARLRLEELGIAHAAVVFGDGLAVPREAGVFDRILVHGCLESVPGSLLARLAIDGRMVMARPDRDMASRQILTELSFDRDGNPVETPRGTCRLQAIIPGLARMM